MRELDASNAADYLLETGRVVMYGEADVLRDDEAVRKAYLGY